MDIFTITSAFMGILFGFLAAYLWLSAKYRNHVPRSDLKGSEQDLAQARENLRATEATRDVALADKEGANRELSEMRRQVGLLESSKAALEANFHSQKQKLEEQKSELEQMKIQLKTEFENLANKILEEKTKSFSETNRSALDIVLSPIRDKFDTFEKAVKESYIENTRETTALKTQIEQLTSLNTVMTKEAQNLTQALRGDSQKQGKWGEMVLERVLEMGGLRNGHEYELQFNTIGLSGQTLRPDAVIKLPEEKYLIVDSKVSLVAYERATSALNEEEALKFQNEHLASIRAHIRGLYGKKYDELFGNKSPDFVLMFIPIEAAFAMALNRDTELYREALEKGIVLVTPSTLLATVRMVAALWRQQRQNQNIEKITAEGAAMIEQVKRLYDELDKVKRNFGIAGTALDDAIKRLTEGRGNLLRRAHNMQALGIKANVSLPEAGDE